MFDFGFQLPTSWCVRAMVSVIDFQVQTFMKDRQVVKVNVALVCFFMSFWYKS